MKPSTINNSNLLIPAIFGLLLMTCKFPYQPDTFLMPATPADRYQFPSAAEMTAFTGSSNVKIAYTLKENGVRIINYIDYSSRPPSSKKLKQPAGKENFNSDSPLLSPDGSFVAYFVTPGAVIEGAYIQKLDPDAEPVLVSSKGIEPHWWQDSAGQVFVIFSDNIESSLNPGGGTTFKQKVSLSGAGSLIGQAETIAPYAMNGGLSKDGVYLCTGYKYGAFYNTVTKQLTSINNNFQICNPSIAPDTSHDYLMLFLNFQGTQNMTNPYQDSADYPKNADGSIGQHTVLFIADPTNTVRDFVPISLMGDSYQEWQDPEWSNKPAFAAALAVINGSEADGVIIKNVGDRNASKEVLVFTKGIGKLNITSTPSIWIGN